MNDNLVVRKKRRTALYHLQTLLAILVTLVMLFPLYWMIATSVKSAEEV